MNPLSVNAAIALDHTLRSGDEHRRTDARRARRSARAASAARTARTALERAGV